MTNSAAPSAPVRTAVDADRQGSLVVRLGAIGFAAFLLVNAPSLKILLGNTPLINAAATALVGGLALLHGLLGGRWRMHCSLACAVGLLGGAVLITVMPTLIGWRLTYPGFAGQGLRLAYLVVVFALVAVVARRRDALVFLYAQIAWGALIAGLYLAGIIRFGTGPVHYNTFTLPIGLSSIAILARFMQMEGAWRQLPFLLILLVVNVLGLLNLPGRSPFVFVIVIMLALAVFRRRSLLGKLKEVTRGLVLLAVMVGAGFAAISYVGIEVSSLLVFRIMELVENTDSEARVGIYDVALRLILRQPLGYGLGAYPYLAVGPYPHNFIVELAFAGGVVAAGFAALATTLGLGRAVRSYRTTSEPLTLQLTGVLLYLVCTFMVSYALKDTYVLFCVLGLVFGLTHPREERVALTTGPGGSYSS